MAEFCKQCSMEVWGKDLGDFKGITTPEAWADKRAALVLCEGCGPIQVDPEGRCVSEGCFESHNTKED